jgi:hypothetical protein
MDAWGKPCWRWNAWLRPLPFSPFGTWCLGVAQGGLSFAATAHDSRAVRTLGAVPWIKHAAFQQRSRPTARHSGELSVMHAGRCNLAFEQTFQGDPLIGAFSRLGQELERR